MEQELFSFPFNDADNEFQRHSLWGYKRSGVPTELSLIVENDTVTSMIVAYPTAITIYGEIGRKDVFDSCEDELRHKFGQDQIQATELLIYRTWKVGDVYYSLISDPNYISVMLIVSGEGGSKYIPADYLKEWDEQLVATQEYERAEAERIRKYGTEYNPKFLKIGMTVDEVEKIWGSPSLVMTIMDETGLEYGNYRLTFKQEKLTLIENTKQE